MLNPRGRGDCRQRSSISEYAQGPHGILKPRGRTTTCKATMGRGRLAGVLGHARCGPRCGRRRHSRQGVRRARRLQKKSRPKGQAPNHLPLPLSLRSECAAAEFNERLECRAGKTGTTGPCKAYRGPQRCQVASLAAQRGVQGCAHQSRRRAATGPCWDARLPQPGGQGGRPAILCGSWGGTRRKRELAPRRAQPSFAPRAP